MNGRYFFGNLDKEGKNKINLKTSGVLRPKNECF